MAKERSPSFQFYPKEYLTDENVKAMSLAERGAYVDLLCTCWQEGSIPADVRRLARILGVPVEQMEEMWEFVGPCFAADPENPDRLIHKRLDKEREKQRAWREQRRKAGKASGKARRRKSKRDNDNKQPLNDRSTNDEQQGRQETGDRKVETKEELRRRLFEDEFWPRYPKRAGNRGKKQAASAWRARCREGVEPEAMIEAAKRYHRYCEVEGKLNTGFVLLASTFLNDPENFTNPWTPTTEPKKQAKAPPPPPDSEAAKVRTEKPQQGGERTGHLTLVGKGETDEQERRRKVEEWKRQNADELDALRSDAVDEIGLALQAFAKKPDVARKLVEARVDEIIWHRKLEGAA